MRVTLEQISQVYQELIPYLEAQKSAQVQLIREKSQDHGAVSNEMVSARDEAIRVFKSIVAQGMMATSLTDLHRKMRRRPKKGEKETEYSMSPAFQSLLKKRGERLSSQFTIEVWQEIGKYLQQINGYFSFETEEANGMAQRYVQQLALYLIEKVNVELADFTPGELLLLDYEKYSQKVRKYLAELNPESQARLQGRLHQIDEVFGGLGDQTEEIEAARQILFTFTYIDNLLTHHQEKKDAIEENPTDDGDSDAEDDTEMYLKQAVVSYDLVIEAEIALLGPAVRQILSKR